MLVCALLVWAVFPFENFDKKPFKRMTYLTEIDCKNSIKNPNDYCILIDKRKDFSLEEWNQDNCGRSEHQWIGQ